MRGTPKTLSGAIQNAFVEYKEEGKNSEQRLRKLLKLHLQDFVRNKIGPTYLVASDFDDNDEPDMMRELEKFMKSIK